MYVCFYVYLSGCVIMHVCLSQRERERKRQTKRERRCRRLQQRTEAGFQHVSSSDRRHITHEAHTCMPSPGDTRQILINFDRRSTWSVAVSRLCLCSGASCHDIVVTVRHWVPSCCQCHKAPLFLWVYVQACMHASLQTPHGLGRLLAYSHAAVAADVLALTHV